MKIDKKLMRTLAQTADIVNTISGGTIFPTFNTTKEEDHYRLEVSVPSVDPDTIKVEVNSGHLLVFQQMSYKNAIIPNLLGMLKLKPDVEQENITAEYEDGLLVVIMPFSETLGGFRRDIDILKN